MHEKISNLAGLDCTNKKFTNHSLQKTTVRKLQKAGISNDKIAAITGHCNKQSLRNMLMLILRIIKPLMQSCVVFMIIHSKISRTDNMTSFSSGVSSSTCSSDLQNLITIFADLKSRWTKTFHWKMMSFWQFVIFWSG